jgi:transcriptional regulator with XRE-family HTH domain
MLLLMTTIQGPRGSAPPAPPTAGSLLRLWRERRRLSQLELSNQAEVSTRHLSFVETGRSAPSRDMLLHLAEHLEVPLRERNVLLLAGGFAPVYAETDLAAPQMGAVRRALQQVLWAAEPNPVAVLDRRWNLIDANRSIAAFTAGAAERLLVPPVNVLRLSLAPDGMAPNIVNLGEWRAHLLTRLRRQVVSSGDPALAALLDELRSYPCDQPEPDVELPGVGDVVVPLRIRAGDDELAFFSTVTTFGTPLDVTVSEMVIESFFPADASTAEALRARPVG